MPLHTDPLGHRRLPLLLIASLLGCSCALSEAGGGAAPASAEHPLVGVVWSSLRGERIGPDELDRSLRAARFVLLGEQHDDPHHHRLQAQLIERLSPGPRPPAVVFEMLDPTQQPAVDALQAEWRQAGRRPEAPAAADALAERVGWAASGWPDFALYRPLFERVLEARLPVLAGGLPRDESLRPDAPERAARYGLDRPLPPEEAAARLDEMFLGHCELVPREALAPMVEKQRARDVRMAHRLWQAAGADGRAVLVAGNGHVKRGRVATALVRAGVDRAQILSVGLLEVDPEHPRISQTRAEDFDLVVFTEAIERSDPCEVLRQRDARAGPAPSTTAR